MKYYVIGGQYQSFFYGTAKTIEEAKRIAEENAEYWDNWQGWHVPNIYRGEDVVEICNFYGSGYGPKDGSYPSYVGEFDIDKMRVCWTEVEL